MAPRSLFLVVFLCSLITFAATHNVPTSATAALRQEIDSTEIPLDILKGITAPGSDPFSTHKATSTWTSSRSSHSFTQPSQTPSSAPRPSPTNKPQSQTTWTEPAHFTDLSAFNITDFASGKNNTQIVTSIPGVADTQNSSLIQVFYPAGSVDPARTPVGGTDFYASPLDLRTARGATLKYSVFIPAGFDWVLGGKMPGLYGGHTGCSGGNAALDCFSTRLMWREGGAGELYLYAPRERQTKALCADSKSVCSGDYGVSVGRGSFTWGTGVWTTVEQTLVLNTPGRQDGVFELLVNGARKIYRTDVFYREDLNNEGQTNAPSTRVSHSTTETTRTTKHTTRSSMETWSSIATSRMSTYRLQSTASPSPSNGNGTRNDSPALQALRARAADGPLSGNGGSGGDVVELAGIFFCTFFGGHDDKYATPRDQYVWFKDVSLTRK